MIFFYSKTYAPKKINPSFVNVFYLLIYELWIEYLDLADKIYFSG